MQTQCSAWANEGFMTHQPHFKFRLYMAGDAPNSQQALVNLNAFCRAYLAERHDIETINILCEDKAGLADGVFVTPTLVKLAPPPVRHFVGTLHQTSTLLVALKLDS